MNLDPSNCSSISCKDHDIMMNSVKLDKAGLREHWRPQYTSMYSYHVVVVHVGQIQLIIPCYTSPKGPDSNRYLARKQNRGKRAVKKEREGDKELYKHTHMRHLSRSLSTALSSPLLASSLHLSCTAMYALSS